MYLSLLPLSFSVICHLKEPFQDPGGNQEPRGRLGHYGSQDREKGCRAYTYQEDSLAPEFGG